MYLGIRSNPVSKLGGIDCIIVYTNMYLSKTKHNYLTHNLEFMSLKLAIMEQFHNYLYSNSFALYMDNNPLTYILISVKLDATGHPWVASLANYNFALSY